MACAANEQDAWLDRQAFEPQLDLEHGGRVPQRLESGKEAWRVEMSGRERLIDAVNVRDVDLINVRNVELEGQGRRDDVVSDLRRATGRPGRTVPCGMQLLVSVSSPDEAQSALAGGADIIDAKDPSQGPLGAVAEPGVRSIAALVRGRRPCTAALGDAGDASGIEDMARRWGAAGASLVKVGFAGVRTAPRVADLVAAAVRGAAAGNSRVIAVAYADHARAASLPIALIVDAASRGGAAGILIDTADKTGPGLCDLLTPQALASLVHRLHELGLIVALAGRLRPHDLPIVRDTGAAIAGVRGAACAHGRQGPIIASRVRALRDLCAPSARAAPHLPA